MNHRNQKLSLAGLVATGLLTFGGTAIASHQDADDDAWIVASTKMAMWTSPGVPSTDVDVDSLDGNVVLHGKVNTTAERDAAERIARGIQGVHDVRNLVQVVPPSKENAVEESDEIVDKRVKQAMKSERGLKTSKVTVSSVNKGVVLLVGESRTLSEHVLAVQTAHSVKGVRYVATQVNGPKGYTDDDIAKGDAKTRGHFYITTAVKMRLLANPDVPALDVKVDARGGMVILFGIVPTEKAKKAAESDALKVSGVDRVLNDLQVVPAADRKVVEAKDDQTQLAVKKAIETRDELKKVDVLVKNGVVRLSGNVTSEGSRLKATVLARSTTGVRSVDNDVVVKRKE